MDEERVVFADEIAPGRRLRILLSGPLDECVLGALTDYVARQRRRLDAGAGGAEDGDELLDELGVEEH